MINQENKHKDLMAVLNLLYNVYVSGKGFVFFSLEMNSNQVIQIFIEMSTGISTAKMRSQKLSEVELQLVERETEKIKSSDRIFIYDNQVKINEIVSMVRYHRRKHGIELFCIDYLQLMETKEGNNREQGIAHMSRTLKNLSSPGDAECSIIVLSRRKVE